jgi:hypothetical protein
VRCWVNVGALSVYGFMACEVSEVSRVSDGRGVWKKIR